MARRKVPSAPLRSSLGTGARLLRVSRKVRQYGRRTIPQVGAKLARYRFDRMVTVVPTCTAGVPHVGASVASMETNVDPGSIRNRNHDNPRQSNAAATQSNSVTAPPRP